MASTADDTCRQEYLPIRATGTWGEGSIEARQVVRESIDPTSTSIFCNGDTDGSCEAALRAVEWIATPEPHESQESSEWYDTPL